MGSIKLIPFKLLIRAWDESMVLFLLHYVTQANKFERDEVKLNLDTSKAIITDIGKHNNKVTINY